MFKKHFTSCFIDDAYGLRNLDLIGEDRVMHKVDYRFVRDAAGHR